MVKLPNGSGESDIMVINESKEMFFSHGTHGKTRKNSKKQRKIYSDLSSRFPFVIFP